jgi:hypothetical protein
MVQDLGRRRLLLDGLELALLLRLDPLPQLFPVVVVVVVVLLLAHHHLAHADALPFLQ